MKRKAGINGFGRFGLHLLKYWLDRNQESELTIDYINDDTLSLEKAYNVILNDQAVIFNKYKINLAGNVLIFQDSSEHIQKVQYTHTPQKEGIPWLGKPDFLFECSGKNTTREDCQIFLRGNTHLVIISATSWNAEKTLIYGFNHEQYQPSQQVISYGSCTVNAYVPLANYLEETYGIADSDVNVIHNLQSYRLKQNYTLIRKFCTLEKSGPHLLNFLGAHNFTVNYTVVPYTGVSMLDFRFRLKHFPRLEEVLQGLEYAFSQGTLKNLYGFGEVDTGPEVYNCTTYSAVFIKENAKIINQSLYLYGYFDNENSVNRYFDLASYIATKHK